MEASPDRNDRITLALGWLVAACLLIVPLAVTPDLIDRYRVIKESLSRAEAILGAFGLIVALTLTGSGRFREILRERALVAVVGAGVAWAIVTTLVSTHRAHSVESLVTFLTCVLVFVTAWYAAPRIRLLVLDLLVITVLINVVLVALQEYGMYQPFPTSLSFEHHVTTTGLLGNPNIVGSYMALVTVIFVVAAARTHGARRLWYAFGTLCAAAGVLLSQARSAVIALVAGLLLFAIGASVKRAASTVAAMAALFAIGAALDLPAVTRLLSLPRTVAQNGLDVATSGRLMPILAALEMARDRPLTGLGPGTFKYHYMPYKVRAAGKHPHVVRHAMSENFGEVHNDHVQLIAETGVVGYLLFLATVAVLIRRIRTAESPETRPQIARAMIVPLAGTLLTLCLAQFPLYVPISRHLIVTMAGLLTGWSRGCD
ncbi:MAG: O-antigen ligase family protein [Thermoanaerobaculia bacterium]